MADAVDIANLNVNITVGSVEKAKKQIDNAKDAIKRVGNEAKKNTSKLGKFAESLKRIALYRTARWVLKELFQGFREGTMAMYQWSLMSGTTFAKSLNTMSTSLQNAKNSLAVAIAPIIENVIVPAIEKLSSILMSAGNAIARFLAILAGQKTYTIAVTGATKQYAKAVNDAKKSVLGFDELNVLNGMSSGGDSYDYSSAFKEVDVGAISDFESKAAEAIGKIKSVLSDALDWAKRNLKSAFDWTIDNFDYVLGAAEIVGLALLAWKIAPLLFPSLENLSSTLLGVGETGKGAFNGILNAIGLCLGVKGIVDLKKAFDEFGDKGEGSCKKITDALSEIFYSLGLLTKNPFIITIGFAIQAIGEIFDNDMTNVVRENIVNQDDIRWAMGYNGKNGTYTTPNANITISDIAKMSGLSMGEIARKNGLSTRSLAALPAGTVIKLRANGGYLNSGDMFLANENGNNEFIGRIGNRSAVANNDQIVEAVSIGVYNAVSSALNGRNNNMSVKVYLDGREMSNAMYKYNKEQNERHGASLVAGGW